MNTDLELKSEQLRWYCEPESLGFEYTSELCSYNEFIGQERAIRSIEFGLDLERPGYNLFLTGITGTGRVGAIKYCIAKKIKDQQTKGILPQIFDWCYIFNFDSPDRPQVLKIPAGEGKKLSIRLENLLKNIKEILPKAFAGEEYKNQKQILIDEEQRKNRQIIQELERMALQENFAFRMTSMGPILVPLVDGKPMTQEQYIALSETEKETIEERRRTLLNEINNNFEKIHELEIELKNKISDLDYRIADFAITPLFKECIQPYEDQPEIVQFIDFIKKYTLTYLQYFRDSQEATTTPQLFPFQRLQDPFLPFKINILVDNSDRDEPPVIFESHPNWTNLFGRIERKATMGTYYSDHTMLKPGSLHLANSGYIIMYFRDLIMNPGVWEGLKRALKNHEIKIEDPWEQFGLVAPQGLTPEPHPFNAKVILVGDDMVYRLLTLYDEDFKDLFKVKADFDFQLDKNNDVIHSFACYVKKICENENLLPFENSGVARLLEHASRRVSHQDKLVSQFGYLKDIVVESDHWARQDHSEKVTRSYVERTLRERKNRHNQIEDKIQELIDQGIVLIDIENEVIGQINGLSVYELGDYSFGKPSRITVKTYLGRQGLINIERESRMSGKIFDKGILIISGYLGHTFAQDKPLSISASICFEQSYEGVEGDSASLAETCAILSSLGEIPIRQNIAVTGSINQKGEVQAIGGVNQKIEGFFQVCKNRGLTSKQGVIIPASNIQNLMLDDEIIQAVREGLFHVFAVKNVDEAIEILTGMKAGKLLDDGTYEPGTIKAQVDEKIRIANEKLKKFSEMKENEKKDVSNAADQ